MRLSVQLYTLRDPLEQDLAGTLSKVRQIGLEYVELAGTYGRSAEEWKTLLDAEGLKVSASHTGIDALRNDFDAVVRDAKTLGFNYVVVPWVNADDYKGDWTKLGKELEPYGRRLAEQGLTLAYHNHAFEFEGDGLDALYAATDKSALKAQLDLAWVKIGGQDPAAYLRKHADRTPLVHLKDYDATKKPQWTPAGQGTLDFDSVLAACQEAGVEFGSIELDESPGDPIDAVRQSFEFFSSKGLK